MDKSTSIEERPQREKEDIEGVRAARTAGKRSSASQEKARGGRRHSGNSPGEERGSLLLLRRGLEVEHRRT